MTKSIIIVTILLVGSISVGLFSTNKSSVGGGTGFGSGSSFSGTAGVTDSFISGTLTQGGGINATSTSGNVVPLLSTDFDTENVIDVTLNVVDATLSFPATSTLTSFIPTAGQTRTLLVRNASTTAAMDLTITGGTGVLLKKATTTAIIIGDTDGANYGRIELTRKADTDIEAILQIFID